ncbi:MAG: GNAT family N-acetyltransferase [Saprospiraceae bacterium]|nr:GNAT family N-acetyltransferase [Saprospiraceae bacterium]
MKTDNVEVVEGQIDRETYQHLRISCGLSAKGEEACLQGLPNSLYSVMLKKDDAVIGMGRVIGDGGCFCQVVDICVLPSEQGKGLGKRIMEHITNYLITALPPTCYTSLIADGEAHRLYAQFGFRETFPVSRGMFFKSPK